MGQTILAILILLLFFAAVSLLKTAVVRVPSLTAEEELDDWEKHRGWEVGMLREGLAWYRTQETETIWITGFDGLRLAADYLPAEGTARGRILLFHGYHGGTEDYAAALPFYHSLGFDLLLPDQRAHNRSEGKYIGFGVLERRDCRAWAEEADRRWGEKPTFLAGVSMGATTVLMAAGENLPADVRGIVADCGFTSPKEEICHVMRTRMHLPPYPIYWLVNGLCRVVAGYGFHDCSTLTVLAHTTLPVLLIHGEADDFVPPEMTRRAWEACASEKELLMVPGAGHCRGYLVDPAGYQQALSDFFARHCPQADGAADAARR